MLLSVQVGLGLSSVLGILPSYAQENQTSPAPSSEELLTVPRTLEEAGLSEIDILSQTPETTAPETTASETTAPATAPSTPTSPYAPISPQIGGSFTSGTGNSNDRGFMSLEGFMPLNQTPGRRLSYLQGRFNITPDGGHPSGNVMLGYRHFNDKSGNILGGYLGLDLRDTGRSSFTQLGLGLETVSPTWEARLNGYVPLGNQRQQVAESVVNTITGTASTTTAFQGNYLLYISTLPGGERRTTRVFDNSLGGFDLEGGVKLAGWNQGDLRGYLGTYYYGGPEVSTWGIRSRLAAKINDSLHTGLLVQNDPEFGTTAVVTVGVTFPGTRSRGTAPEQKNWSRMAESPYRQSQVAVTTKTQTEVVSLGRGGSNTTQAINPATGKPWFFQHVRAGATAGDGTFESPFGEVNSDTVPTDGNGIIYVQAGDGTTLQGFTIPDNVQALSSGIPQEVAVPEGVLTLPLSGSGTFPKVGGTVVMGNNTTLAGFNITGFAGSGIVGTDVRNLTIRDNTISNLANNGIFLDGNLTGNLMIERNTISSLSAKGIVVTSNQPTVQSLELTIRDNTISDLDDNGISVDGNLTGNLMIERNTLSSLSAKGIAVNANQVTAQPLEVTISDNNINKTSATGISVFSGTKTTGTFTIANNTVEQSSGFGIDVRTSSAGKTIFFIDSNQVKDVQPLFGGHRGINVSNDGATGKVSALITNNEVNNPSSSTLNSVEFNIGSYPLKLLPTNLCVRVQNNKAPNTGFRFQGAFLSLGFMSVSGVVQRESLVTDGNSGTVQEIGKLQNVPSGTCGF